MTEEYIGSQQHFEDWINEDSNRKKQYEEDCYAEMQKQYEKDMQEQLQSDFGSLYDLR